MQSNYKLINECIICLESNDTNNLLTELKDYNKNCNCNSPIHKKCLLKWYKYNTTCPICRTSAIINEPINNASNETQYCICHGCHILCTIFFVFLFIIVIYNNKIIFKF